MMKREYYEGQTKEDLIQIIMDFQDHIKIMKSSYRRGYEKGFKDAANDAIKIIRGESLEEVTGWHKKRIQELMK
jgi:hypothetical protein